MIEENIEIIENEHIEIWSGENRKGSLIQTCIWQCDCKDCWDGSDEDEVGI